MPGKTIDDILALAEDDAYTRVVTVKVAMIPQALREEHAELDSRLDDLSGRRDTVDIPPEQLEVAERLRLLEEQIEASRVEFRFRCVGHRAWADLEREHPPSKDQLRENPNLPWNPDTFCYDAMAASCAEPEMTADEVRRLEASTAIDRAAWNSLWDACLRANVVDAAPKSFTASILLANAGSSKRPTTTKSRGRSSLAG